MSCPTCGGTDRVAVAPGYFRCTTENLEVHPGAGLDGTDVGGTVRCQREYHEATGMTRAQVCRCGTFAVRRCTGCQVALCGDCSVADPGSEATRWLCAGCRDEGVRKRRDDRETHYRSLPPVSADEMREFLAGRRPDIVDGTTHQFWAWTNEDVAAALAEAGSSGPFRFTTDGVRFGLYWGALMPDGRRVSLEEPPWSPGEGRPRPPDKIESVLAGPDARFNDHEPVGLSGLGRSINHTSINTLPAEVAANARHRTYLRDRDKSDAESVTYRRKQRDGNSAGGDGGKELLIGLLVVAAVIAVVCFLAL